MFSRVILRRIDPAAAAAGRGDDIEHQPLSPREAEPSTEPEMAERSQARFSRLGMRRNVPSRIHFSSSTQTTSSAGSEWPAPGSVRASTANTPPVPRPNSNNPRPEDDDNDDLDSDLERQSTLPSRYSVVVDLPGTRLYLPGLQRTWTQGSNGPPTSRPAELVQPQRRPLSPACRPHTPSPPTQPYPVHTREPERTRVIAVGASPTRLGSQEADELYPAGDNRARGQFRATDPAEAQLAEMAEDGRRRRQRGGSDRGRRRQRRDEAGRRPRRRQQRMGAAPDAEDDAPLRKPPKHFLFCLPWVKSRKIRSQIVQSFVSGMFLVLLASVCKFCSETCLMKEQWLIPVSPCCRYCPVLDQEHHQPRILRPPHPRHPLFIHLLLPKPSSTMFLNIPPQAAHGSSSHVAKRIRARRVRHSATADSRGACAG